MGWLDGLLPSDDERAKYGQMVRGGLANYLNGVDNMAPQTNADAAHMALSMAPGVGNVMAGQDAYNYANQGDWGKAAASAFGMIPFLGAGMIKAFHGSPHNFNRFDMSKIGTGEGAQAYGHGLYFAESEPVAQSYRDALGSKPQFASDAEETAAQHQTPGKMYEVNINADPEHFLDFDKPLSQQPENVKQAIRNQPLGQHTLDLADSLRLKGSYIAPKNAEQAKAFAEAGVPGVKYLDQGSRTAGEGSRNYVVFDDKLISIVRKYGIPGAIGLGLITPEIGRQMQEQGL